MRSTVRTVSVLVAGVAAVLAAASGVAQADPTAGTVPASTDLVGVGSDTSQILMNDLAAGYNATGAATKLYSWDATGSAQISTKAGCGAVNRPNGSGAGINALIADGTAHCIDFARSSRRPSGTEATNYAFVEYARDSLSYATAATSNVPATLTTQALHDIYASADGSAACAYTAYLPQSGSGTRSFFLASIGLSEATKGSCAKDAWTGGSVEEHDPAALVGNPNALAPFSVGRAIPHTSIKVNSIDDSVRPAGVTNTVVKVNPGNAQVPGAGEPSVTAYDRAIFNVVHKADFSTAKYQDVFGEAGFICNTDAAIATIAKDGFRLSDNCGIAAAS